MITLLIIFGFLAAGSGIWIAALTAPAGFEDESGFHFGVEQRISPQRSGKKIGASPRISSKSAVGKKHVRKKHSDTAKAAPKQPRRSPYSDQMKFPFPVTH